MKPLDTDVRILGLMLGLGDLQERETCHGYATGCVCKDCTARVERVRELQAMPRVTPEQPWIPKPPSRSAVA